MSDDMRAIAEVIQQARSPEEKSRIVRLDQLDPVTRGIVEAILNARENAQERMR